MTSFNLAEALWWIVNWAFWVSTFVHLLSELVNLQVMREKIDVIEHISYLVSNHKRCFTLTVFLFLYNCTSEVGHTALHNHRNSFTLNYWPRIAIYILCSEISRNLDFKGKYITQMVSQTMYVYMYFYYFSNMVRLLIYWLHTFCLICLEDNAC